jgi:RecJ-like exonuclease
MDWITHDEDVWFEFRGDSPDQLVQGRYYKGTVDGFADFGVFVDLAPGVTGLLHRSELDRRLESLDWEAGDAVFVQVKNIRDNGDVDLAWSKRQSESSFRGARIHDPGGDDDGEPIESGDAGPEPVRHRPVETSRRNVARTSRSSSSDGTGPDASGSAGTADETRETDGPDAGSDRSAGGGEAVDEGAAGTAAAATAAPDSAAGDETEAADADAGEEPERVAIESLGDRVGETVRIEGEVVGARQTGGPTVFEVRDETGVVDCAAFVEAGVRAYPEVDVGDVVRLDGEVELRRNELQVETDALVELVGAEADAVGDRLSQAMSDRARPEAVMPLAAHEAVEAVAPAIQDAAEAIRRAVFESRPIVVRHAATADGYVAGAAVERAVLPLIREEHARADAEYHFFARRPLEDAVYDMDAATSDVTRMLEDHDRHGEKFPLVLLVGTGSTAASADGLGLLGVYDATRVVVDAATADEEVAETVEVLVNPDRADDLSTGALTANLAGAVNDDVRDDLRHLPAVSYWEGPPEQYVELAEEAGYAPDRVRELREAVALEAYYQSYEDKRELITDLLFEGGAPEGEGVGTGGLAGHVSEQFRTKLEDEVETAAANLEFEEREGVRFAVLDSEAYTHRFDFPPTPLLLDELHRRNRGDAGEPLVTVGVGTDELYLRSTADLDVRAVAAAAADREPGAGISAVGVREGRIEFLSGARDAVREAIVAAVAEAL